MTTPGGSRGLPSGDQIAATCQGLVLLDPIGSTEPRTLTETASAVALGWSGDALLIARVTNAPVDQVHVDIVDPATGLITAGPPLDHDGIELMVGGCRGLDRARRRVRHHPRLVSSGRSLVVRCASGLYRADHAGGPLHLMRSGVAESFDGWTADGTIDA